MKINTEKRKVISDSTTNLTIENEEIVKEFKFLWSTSDNVKQKDSIG